MATQRKIITIDGASFSDRRGFFREISSLLMNAGAGKAVSNLDALNDLLRGGFGVHDYGEALHIIWKDAAKSRRELTDAYFEKIVNVITADTASGHDCTMELKF